MNMKSILALVAFSFLACAQPVVLHPPAPAAMAKSYIETFPAAQFVTPGAALQLAHTPDLGTVVTVSLKGTSLFDQTSVKRTAEPLTVNIDPAGLAPGATIVVEYVSSI